MATSILHVRIDDDLKVKALQVLGAIGLSAADAVHLLFQRIVAEQALPSELKVPNAQTLAAMKESRQLMLEGKARFIGTDEMSPALSARNKKARHSGA